MVSKSTIAPKPDMNMERMNSNAAKHGKASTANAKFCSSVASEHGSITGWKISGNLSCGDMVKIICDGEYRFMVGINLFGTTILN